jgi:pyruvate formate lyase activating enzyme
MIPGENDSEAEIEKLTQWVMTELGPDVPLHFTAFHPDWKMRDKAQTPAQSLFMARNIALRNGLHFVYTGNVRDPQGNSTWCTQCGSLLIGREGYEITAWQLNSQGNCSECGTNCPGIFEDRPGDWGSRRQPVQLHQH